MSCWWGGESEEAQTRAERKDRSHVDGDLREKFGRWGWKMIKNVPLATN